MKTILIVEDEEHLRKLYRDELIDEGYRVIVAGDGDQGFEYYQDQRPDLVTIDIKMQGTDGISLMHKIRKLDKKIPIILYTAYGEYSQDFLTWAANEYLVKSSDLEQLKRKIRKLLSDS
ncbi:MAG: response regulator [Actinomycetia bacterium]|nr:response regulator [Actinomycetes bacterium]